MLDKTADHDYDHVKNNNNSNDGCNHDGTMMTYFLSKFHSGGY